MAGLRASLYPVGSLERSIPHHTAVMRQREAEARTHGRRYRIDQRWEPYARISPLLRRAILIAEDDAFYTHGGLDWNELGAAARADLEKRRIVRGGSTITQQLAKNLYLGDQRTITRKLTEIFLAFRLEAALTKRRIFELYLNEIEWGDGIFGAGAASQRYFHVSPDRLNERQSILLAAIIVNPLRYSPLRPDRKIERRVRMIAGRLRRRGFLSDEQYRLALGGAPPPKKANFFDWFFGSPKPSPPPAPAPAAPESSGAESLSTADSSAAP